jgi:hypothetical protein
VGLAETYLQLIGDRSSIQKVVQNAQAKKKNADDIQIEAARLYADPRPNVSFPVPYGEPALGSSG